jgi:hypothetical protein
MKPLLWLLALTVLSYSTMGEVVAPDRHVLIIAGATDGYLSPCGCVKPMSGGLRRRVTAIRQLSVPDKTTVIETGGFVKDSGRQDQMKAEAIAETMKLVKVAAINYGLEEARLGAGIAASLDRLSGEALVATGLPGAEIPVKRLKASGPFLIGGVDPRTEQIAAAIGTQPEPVEDSVKALTEEARESKLVPVLMTRGDLESAEGLAKKHPELKLIVCSAKSSPFETPRKVGDTLIVTPGEHAKYVVRIEWDGERFSAYRFFDLGPEYADDRQAQEVYAAYLARVASEDLLSMVPRSESPQFYGNAECISCHPAAGRVWKESAHSKALATLEKDGQDRDPDCTGCHVVGLRAVNGFKSRAVTPNLTDVGCESCHGPGDKHRMSPYTNKMGKVGRESCMPCHNTEHSPTFDFDAYWAKIKH